MSPRMIGLEPIHVRDRTMYLRVACRDEPGIFGLEGVSVNS